MNRDPSCNRCEIKLSEDPVPIGQATVVVNIPGVPDFRRAGRLCGDCALQLVEFMAPIKDEGIRREYAAQRAEYEALLVVRREQQRLGGQ